MKQAHNRVEMIGQIFNNWKVLSESHKKSRIVYYKCTCLLCSEDYIVDGRNVRSGRSSQCLKCGHKKTREANLGKKRPASVGKKISEAKKGKKLSKSHVEAMKGFSIDRCDPVLLQIDPTPSSNERGLRISNYINTMKQKAKSRKKEWKLPKHLVAALVVKNCHYCGATPEPYNGLDRVDSSIGYLPNNVVTCCKYCNSAKLQRSKGEFLQWIKRLYENNY